MQQTRTQLDTRWRLGRVARSLFRRTLWIGLTVKYAVLNRLRRAPVTSPSGVAVVSLGTHGVRATSSYLTLESIASGRSKPRRLIVAYGGPRPLPAALRRLEVRGVEFLDDKPEIGPHNKYYYYVMSTRQHDAPLVTADDDVFYGDDWLSNLLNAHFAKGGVIVGNWARTIRLESRSRLETIEKWPWCQTQSASPFTFVEGVWGVLYPPEFLSIVRANGDAFLPKCPRQDDVWLNALALGNAFPVRQLRDHPTMYVPRYRAQAKGLSTTNFGAGENDIQIANTYDDRLLEILVKASTYRVDS